ncbi:MAG: methyltransferase domain-containing protein [Cytophagales bacterium]|nr:methyltransferase domain-containing protein [Cytophagales bacterium]
MARQKEWFGEWFDSPYYHILYNNRDYREARHFIDRLLERLQPGGSDKLMDLACGKGRHSIYLSEKGLDVTGVDLSEQSIQHARRFEKENLRFFPHDMREVFRPEGFDYVLNLFTSFGYFPDEEENFRAIEAAVANLKQGGVLVLDYLNPVYVVSSLVAEEKKTVDGIEFSILKKVEDGYIVKDIRFEDGGQAFHFQERVRLISKEQFEELFERAGLRTKQVFGDYSLGSYQEGSSDRMIFIAEKK